VVKREEPTSSIFGPVTKTDLPVALTVDNDICEASNSSALSVTYCTLLGTATEVLDAAVPTASESAE
jgi:hypothetical protein